MQKNFMKVARKHVIWTLPFIAVFSAVTYLLTGNQDTSTLHNQSAFIPTVNSSSGQNIAAAQKLIKSSYAWLEPLFRSDGSSLLRDMAGADQNNRPECRLRKFLEKAYWLLQSLQERFPQGAWQPQYLQLMALPPLDSKACQFLQKDCAGVQFQGTAPIALVDKDGRTIKSYAWYVYGRLQQQYLPQLRQALPISAEKQKSNQQK